MIDKPEVCHLFITWDYLPSAWNCTRNNACAMAFKQKSSTQYTSTALSIIQVRINSVFPIYLKGLAKYVFLVGGLRPTSRKITIKAINYLH